MKNLFVKIILPIILFVGVGCIIYLSIHKTVERQKENPKPNKINISKESIQEKKSEEKKNVDKVLSTGSTIGFFQGIEWGDYCHFVIKDENGKGYQYFLSDELDIDIEKYEKDQSYIGKKFKVSWQEVERYIPEGGGNYVIIEMTGLEQLE